MQLQGLHSQAGGRRWMPGINLGRAALDSVAVARWAPSSWQVRWWWWEDTP